MRLLVLVLLSVVAFAETNAGYQKGTATKQAGATTLYELNGADGSVWVKPCGDLQNGQAIEFRIAGDKAYIRRPDGKDSKCSITMRSVPTDTIDPPPTYQKGTILGYKIRRDTNVSGNGHDSVSTTTRDAKVYELRGPDLLYQVDYCGAFQAGQFSPGQVVEFRVNEKEGRLYIRHDVTKEYSCQLEGKRLPAGTPLASVPSDSASANASK